MVISLQQKSVEKLKLEMDNILNGLIFDNTIVDGKIYSSYEDMEDRFSVIVSELTDMGVDVTNIY